MITVNMARVPQWPGLKHFLNVTTKDINDDQSWLDIEKCILPCVVQLLPRNSPLKLTELYEKLFDYQKQQSLSLNTRHSRQRPAFHLLHAREQRFPSGDPGDLCSAQQKRCRQTGA
ncbi:hypothetical protein C8R44DRAFT_952959 [Mycena epipterygia]|nr:hypothetical protein C8R44DRAFT_952959 [Mycena epipterygia]